MAAKKPAFLRGMPDKFIRKVKGDDGKVRVSIPGTDGLSLLVDEEMVFPAADKHGVEIKNHSNVKLGMLDDELDVMAYGDDGNLVKKKMTAGEVMAAWSASQKEYAGEHGNKVFLNGVDKRMIHESKLEVMGRHMLIVSVPDPESEPQPVRRPDGQAVPGQYRSHGYGSFLVSPDAVVPCSSDPGKVNIYLGRENDTVRGYQIFTGNFDEDGRGIYEKARRTAGEVKDRYVQDFNRFASRRAEREARQPVGVDRAIAGQAGSQQGVSTREGKNQTLLRIIDEKMIKDVGNGKREITLKDDLTIVVDESRIGPSRNCEGMRLDGKFDVVLLKDEPVEAHRPHGDWMADAENIRDEHLEGRHTKCVQARILEGSGQEMFLHGVPEMMIKRDYDRNVAIVETMDAESIEMGRFEVPLDVLDGTARVAESGEKVYDIPLGLETTLVDSYQVKRFLPDGSEDWFDTVRTAADIGSPDDGPDQMMPSVSRDREAEADRRAARVSAAERVLGVQPERKYREMEGPEM